MNGKRLLVTGDRNWTDAEQIRSLLSKLQEHGYTTLIHGDARGVDRISGYEAKRMGYEVILFPAQWDKYHRGAGPIRNQQMLDEGKPDMVVYFHNDLANSKGTADMVRRATKANLIVFEGSPQ